MKFDIIYADPPWSFKVWNKKGKTRTAESYYDTMSNEELYKLKVSELSNDNAVLLLWVPNSHLESGLNLIKNWGFVFKTIGFIWVKTTKNGKYHFGMGHYTRPSCEVCLIAIKGKGLKRELKNIRQLVISQIMKHSKKPSEVRSKIKQLFGNNKNYLEMFATEKCNGWTSIGNEISNLDIRKEIENLINKK